MEGGSNWYNVAEDLRTKLRAALAPGWDIRSDENGYTYFENSATGETSWDVPTLASEVARLENELSTMKRTTRPSSAKTAEVKEAALKADINKMKAETRQAKKEMNEAKRDAEARVLSAQETVARVSMQAEEDLLRIVEEHTEMIQEITQSIRSRDINRAHESMQRLRLLESIHVVPVVVGAVKDAIEEFDTHQDLVKSLEESIRKLEEDLQFEKAERARENEEWRLIVEQRDSEIQYLQGEVAARDQRITQLETYIAEAEERHRVELERARQFDRNEIASLEAQLAKAKSDHEETMLELAGIWPNGIPPPSLLRKYVIPMRQREAADRQERAQQEMKIGSIVQAWDESSAAYHNATVTAIKDDMVEVRWLEGSEDPPLWLSAHYCFVIAEEDLFKQVSVCTQTDVVMYDEGIKRLSLQRPRSASGRVNEGMEKPDKRAAQALREKAQKDMETRAEEQVKGDAKRLFRLIDIRSQREVALESVWLALLEQQDVRDFVEANPLFQPLWRRDYLIAAWKHVDIDGDVDMPLPIDGFIELCARALVLSRRGAQARRMNEIDDASSIASSSHYSSSDEEQDQLVDEEETRGSTTQEIQTEQPKEASERDLVLSSFTSASEMNKDEAVRIDPWLSAEQRLELTNIEALREEQDALLNNVFDSLDVDKQTTEQYLTHAQERLELAQSRFDEFKTKEFQERTRLNDIVSETQAMSLQLEQVAKTFPRIGGCQRSIFQQEVEQTEEQAGVQDLVQENPSREGASFVYAGQDEFIENSASNARENGVHFHSIDTTPRSAAQREDLAKTPELEQDRQEDSQENSQKEPQKEPEPSPAVLAIDWEAVRGNLEHWTLVLDEEIVAGAKQVQALKANVSSAEKTLQSLRGELEASRRELDSAKAETQQQASPPEQAQRVVQLNKQVDSLIQQVETYTNTLEQEKGKLEEANTKAAHLEDFSGRLESATMRMSELEKEDGESRQAYQDTVSNLYWWNTQVAVLTRSKALWEKASLDASRFHDNQIRMFKRISAVLARFFEERYRNDQQLFDLVDHKELLHARLQDAEQQRLAAANEIERVIAEEHYEFIKEEVADGLKYVQARWEEESKVRKDILDRMARAVRDGNKRLATCNKTLAARKKLRQVLGEEFENELNSGGYQYTVTSSTPSTGVVDRLSEIQDVLEDREAAWMDALSASLDDTELIWIADQEKARLEARVEHAERAARHSQEHYGAAQERLEKEVSKLKSKHESLQIQFQARKTSLEHELDQLVKDSKESLALLHKELQEERALRREVERCAREQLGLTKEELATTKVVFQERIDVLKATLTQNRYWVHTLQEDLRTLRKEHETLKEVREMELRLRARQKDKLRQELEAMTQHAARLDNWVNSLKAEVQGLNDTISKQNLDMERANEAFARERRWLKWETWKRDETIRAVGTNVDSCFSFFLEGLERLAGASREYNERIAANAGIEVLLALLRSPRAEIRRKALAALSASAWDDHVDYRTLCHRANGDWARWVRGVTAVNCLLWRRYGQDQQHMEPSGSALLKLTLPGFGMTVALKDGEPEIIPQETAERRCGTNPINQERIGAGLEGAQSGVQTLAIVLEHGLKEGSKADLCEVEKAAQTLAVLSLEQRNKDRIAAIENVIPLLLKFIQLPCTMGGLMDVSTSKEQGPESFVGSDEGDDSENNQKVSARSVYSGKGASLESEEIQRHCLTTLGNLLFESEENQIKLGKRGGVEILLQVCRTSKNVDVLDRCTAVLANATSLCGTNCEQVGSLGGIKTLVDLCQSEFGQELLDGVGARIQANALETLVNATKEYSSKNARSIESFGIHGLVDLCLSESIQVQESAATILGNIAQDDRIRAAVGSAGGIELLFSLAERDTVLVKRNAVWALSNLAWNARNQDSIGKLLPQLIRLCEDGDPEVRTYAVCTLANSLFYHEGNRRRFGIYTASIRAVVGLLADSAQPAKVHENAARALGTAAYNDVVALQAGILGSIPILIRLAQSGHRGTERTASFALGNLAVHDIHKTMIIVHGGIEAMTHLVASDCRDTSKYADKVLTILADMSRAEELEERRRKYGIQGLLELCEGKAEYDSNGELLPRQVNMQALACEDMNAALATRGMEAVDDFLRHRGHFILVGILEKRGTAADAFERKLRHRAAWTLRTVAQYGVKMQDVLGAAGAVEAIVHSLREHYQFMRKEETEMEASRIAVDTELGTVKLVSGRDVCETALGTLFSIVKGHSKNSRRALQSGLNVFVQIADENTVEANIGKNALDSDEKEREAGTEKDPNLGYLVLQLLQVLGPFSWVRCANCSSKEKGGRTCSQCGHRLRSVIEVD